MVEICNIAGHCNSHRSTFSIPTISLSNSAIFSTAPFGRALVFFYVLTHCNIYFLTAPLPTVKPYHPLDPHLQLNPFPIYGLPHILPVIPPPPAQDDPWIVHVEGRIAT